MDAVPSVGWAYPLNRPDNNCCGVCDPAAADRGAAGNPSETVRFTNNSSGRNMAHPTSRAAARPTPIQIFLFMVPPQSRKIQVSRRKVVAGDKDDQNANIFRC